MAQLDLTNPGATAPDSWTWCDDDAALDGIRYPVVSLTRFLAEADSLLPRIPSIGVRIPNDADLATLAPHLDNLDRIELVMPVFKDGRAFSQLRRLRDHYGFRGDIRVIGHVLADQVRFLQRCGASSVTLKDDKTVETARRLLNVISVVYQDSGDQAQTAMARRHAHLLQAANRRQVSS